MDHLSSIFYNNKMTSSVPSIKEYENWQVLPKAGFPIVFISVPKGKCLFGPVSYRNELEARVVLQYVRKFNDLVVETHTRYRRQGYTAVENDSVGILTPYVYQVRNR